MRIAAKSRESTPSSVDHLTLHSMVKNLDGPDKTELRKYQTLKDELGELTATDASRYRMLRTAAEKEILQVRKGNSSHIDRCWWIALMDNSPSIYPLHPPPPIRAFFSPPHSLPLPPPRSTLLSPQAADVICCTCVGAGDPRLVNFRFRQLLIDESTQAMEAECFIPIGTYAQS